MGRFKTTEERQRKKMEKRPMSLGNLAKKEDLVVTGVDKEAKTATLGTSEDLLTPEQKEYKAKGAAEERQRILGEIFGNKEAMTAEFKVLMRHTGSYLAGSMAIAYSRGFNDIIKLILKEKKSDEKSNQQNEG